MASFPQVSPLEPCAHLSPPSYAPHALPISFFSILSPAQYWVWSADYLAPRYAVSSFPPLPRPSWVQIFSSTPYSQTPLASFPPSISATKFHTHTGQRAELEFYISWFLNFWTATLMTEDSAPNNSKHSLTCRGISYMKLVNVGLTGLVTFCVETAFCNRLLKER